MNSSSASDMQTRADEHNCHIHAALIKGMFVVTLIGKHKTVIKSGSCLEHTMMDAVYAWDADD